MTLDASLIAVLWLVLVTYWAISALHAKRNTGPRPWAKEITLRVAIVVVILVAVRTPALRRALLDLQARLSHSMFIGGAGVALCVLGVGLAIWARVNIGRNWGMPMSRKEHPELVTSGPYTLVRHPIYTGILLAMAGSAIGQTVFWMLPLVLFTVYFVYSARREEQLMIEQFPEHYPAYMKRTRMLLPFVL